MKFENSDCPLCGVRLKSNELSPHFNYNEMVVTSTHIENKPSADDVLNLIKLCRDVLEPIREAVGSPIIVTSAYRSKAVNRAVGGVKNSEHLFGRAADIHVTSVSSYVLYHRIKALVANGIIHVGQCILYPKSHFVHVSLYTSHHKDEFIVKHKN